MSESSQGRRPHVAVIGGGIAGLVAAHTLLAADRERDGGGGPAVEVTLVEAGQRLGGKIRSEPIASERIDVGAESLMARMPAAIELCRELGLEDELVPARETTSAVWARGRPRPLPPGILGGLPDGVTPVLRCGILSPAGLARGALDLLLPRQEWQDDQAVGEIIRRRLGAQALDRLIDPLLGTIYAAHCDDLSARATAPQIDRLARDHRSLIRGLISAKPPPGGGGPLFVTLPGGLERIVSALAERTGAERLRLGVRPGPLEQAADGRYLLSLSDGSQPRVDGAVIAAPADQAAHMLSALSPLAAMRLRSIRYVSTVIVTLRLPGSALRRPPRTAGVLVPAGERRLLGAITSLSAKWEHLASSGEIWMRCSIARERAAEAMHAPDGALIDGVTGELRQMLGLAAAPLDAHVTRWERALPLYRPGHIERVEHIEREMGRLPRVELAGSAYRGIGVPQCIAQGRAAALRLLDALREPTPGRDGASPACALAREGAT